jgi:hypothetical protein
MGYLMLAVVFKIMVTTQFYAGWPNDNLCDTNELVSAFATIPPGSGIAPGDPVYASCNQEPGGGPWVVDINGDWMTHTQKTLVSAFDPSTLLSKRDPHLEK